ncbi:amidohydrolase family protein [Pseudoalteromonas sp. T1lg23B]|uniref:amidohydrolase family protein n=1 Tax=Pseudoalteromonas sp. T1lg23B TaxID=2077097 RepID=UPI000CF71956|nr:amidohydrolase family protein [Pseudoalteromonas sp. T1lg23B]
MTPIIDPHLHFFDLQKGQYQWLLGPNPPAWPNLDKIKQNHGLAQLTLEDDLYLAGLVHIEAGFDNQHPVAELQWLTTHIPSLPYKAIAYLDITQANSDFCAQLQPLLDCTNFIGIRDISEGSEAHKLLHPNVKQNLAVLAEHNLIFEAQFELHHTDIVKHFSLTCQQLPTLQIVLNHSGFLQQDIQWQTGLQLMAQCRNVAIKFSGQEHVNRPLKSHTLLAVLIAAFSDKRVMFASNYPVCLIRAGYADVWHHYRQLVNDDKLWEKLSYSNAKRIYRL